MPLLLAHGLSLVKATGGRPSCCVWLLIARFASNAAAADSRRKGAFSSCSSWASLDVQAQQSWHLCFDALGHV